MARIKLKQVDGISRKPLADAYCQAEKLNVLIIGNNYCCSYVE